MKLLHTSDIHLGRPFHGRARIETQRIICSRIAQIAHDEQCDLVIIAGDVFDSPNPSAEAENVYFNFLEMLTRHRETAVVIIAGNHDSISRLNAPAKVLQERGIFIFGSTGNADYSSGSKPFQWSFSNSVLTIITRNGAVDIVALPFLSEYRLGHAITSRDNRNEERAEFSEIVSGILNEIKVHLRPEVPSLLVTHQFYAGGIGDTTERDISLGGTYSVATDVLEDGFSYIAAGHLHRRQNIGKCKNAYYCGSPISFEFEKTPVARGVIVADIQECSETAISFVPLTDPFPPAIWEYRSFNNLVKDLGREENRNLFIKVLFYGSLDGAQLQQLGQLHPRLIAVTTTSDADLSEVKPPVEKRVDMDDRELFRSFYLQKTGVEPTPELTQTYLRITSFFE